MILLPFPAMTNSTDISKQLEYQQKLEKARKKASRAIGLLISLGKELQPADQFLNEKCIPIVLQSIGENVGPRVMKNYIILMFFIRKVSFKLINSKKCNQGFSMHNILRVAKPVQIPSGEI